MKKPAIGEYRSAVYTNRPPYADYDAPRKFQAIQSIVGKRLVEHPNAICSYSGGADSDILIDVIERTRHLFELPPVKYVFFNTGLEMKATKDHVKATAEKYGVEIETVRPKINIVRAAKKYGIRYSDAYEVYGLTRTGCCGCPISYKAVEDLELIRPYEPNLVKAAWNVFGASYNYRQEYNEYKARRDFEDRIASNHIDGQISMWEAMA